MKRVALCLRKVGIVVGCFLLHLVSFSFAFSASVSSSSTISTVKVSGNFLVSGPISLTVSFYPCPYILLFPLFFFSSFEISSRYSRILTSNTSYGCKYFLSVSFLRSSLFLSVLSFLLLLWQKGCDLLDFFKSHGECLCLLGKMLSVHSRPPHSLHSSYLYLCDTAPRLAKN